MKTINLDIQHLSHFCGDTDLSAMSAEVLKARKVLMEGSGRGNDFLGWVTLPEDVTPQLVDDIKGEVARLSSKAKVFVVVGIGGSYLGARAVIEALQSEFAAVQRDGKFPLVVYAGHTLSEDYYCQLMELLEREDYAVAVISKSGTTTEPAVAFRIIKAHLEKKYGKAEAAQRIVAITDAHKGALHDIAVQEGYHTYVIPDNVGGRFSVLTPVGLLPIAMAGYDINLLLQGARDMRRLCVEKDTLADNPALLYAAVRNV